MAATVRIVPEKDWEVLRNYLFEAGGRVILIPETTLRTEEFPKEDADKLRTLDGQKVDYDFGGEAEVLVDAVTWHGAYAADWLLEQMDEDKEEDEEDEE